MNQSGPSRGALLVGAMLILVGAASLVVRVSNVDVGWPAWVILPGIALLITAFAVPEPGGSGMAAAGGIVTAVGAVLAVQDATGTYASWAYAWAIVAPGGVGAGLLLYGLLTRRGEVARGGFGSLVSGIVLFLVGFLFFEGVLHLNGDRFANLTGVAVPMAIMVIGAAVLLAALIPGPWRRRSWSANPGAGWATGTPDGSSAMPGTFGAAPGFAGTQPGAARMAAGSSTAGGSSAQVLALALDGAADAEVRIAFGAGRLLVGSAASGQLVNGTFEGGVTATPAGAGRIRLTMPQFASWSWNWGRAPFVWRVGLTAEVPLRLEVETGASDNELDLSGMRVTDLRLRTGAAQSQVTLPAAGVTRVQAETGAAQMRFHVPAGVAARITGTMAIGTTDVDTSRFPRTPDGTAWASPDFDANPNRVEIAVRGGVGQVSIA